MTVTLSGLFIFLSGSDHLKHLNIYCKTNNQSPVYQAPKAPIAPNCDGNRIRDQKPVRKNEPVINLPDITEQWPQFIQNLMNKESMSYIFQVLWILQSWL